MLMKLIFVSLLLFLVQHIIKVVYLLGFHLHYYQHYPGYCEQIKDMGPGSEDFHTFPDGLTFITSGFAIQNESVHKREYMVKHNMLGRIYLFDFNKNKAKVEELSIVGSNGGFNVKLFHPHGISGWLDKSGKKILFVVNHERLGLDYIEKFEFVPGKKQLKHVKRYRDDTMLLVNDVQATSDDSFYFTNCGTGHNPEIKLMQSLALLRWTVVVYYDGSNYRIVLDGMAMSNGIAMSNDGRYIYISNHDARELVVAKREANNDLIIKQVYPLYTYIDNIIVDMKTDHLYIGSHPIKYQLARHLDNPEVYRAPSQVLKLEMKDGNVTGTKELFYDDGDLISGSATAIVFNNKLLIGSVLDKTVICSFKVYHLYTYIDNIIVDMKTDHLYIGSHPIKYQLARHLDNPEVYRAPSQVLKLEMKDGNVTGTKELFNDDGDLISGSTTAIVFKNKLLIGSVIDKNCYL